jgi:hypothetical protein
MRAKNAKGHVPWKITVAGLRCTQTQYRLLPLWFSVSVLSRVASQCGQAGSGMFHSRFLLPKKKMVSMSTISEPQCGQRWTLGAWLDSASKRSPISFWIAALVARCTASKLSVFRKEAIPIRPLSGQLTGHKRWQLRDCAHSDYSPSRLSQFNGPDVTILVDRLPARISLAFFEFYGFATDRTP